MDDELRKMLIQIMEGHEQFKIELRKNTEAVIGMESKMMERTEALFDGYKSNTERLSEWSDKVDDLTISVNNLNIKTASTDNKIIEINRKINAK